jgi:plastocyanin
MRRSVFAACATLLLIAPACSGGGGSTAPATNNGTGTGTGSGASQVPANTVIARAASNFDPSSLTVAVGTTVSFVFEATGHNVTFNAVNGRPADIGGSTMNTTITRTFGTAGSFGYQCTIHPGMTGTVIVQ